MNFDLVELATDEGQPIPFNSSSSQIMVGQTEENPTPTLSSSPTSPPTPNRSTSTPAPTYTSTADADLSATPSEPKVTIEPLPTLGMTEMVEVAWPEEMNINSSDSIKVTLYQLQDSLEITMEPMSLTTGGSIPATGPKVITETLKRPESIGGGPLGAAFGFQYEGYAIASLAGTMFEVESVTLDRQSLDQSRITWIWNIAPERAGSQVVDVSIELEWVSTSDGLLAKRLQLWSTSFDILVRQPFITTGRFDVVTVFTGLLGTVLSVPWIYQKLDFVLSKRKKAKALDDKDLVG